MSLDDFNRLQQPQSASAPVPSPPDFEKYRAKLAEFDLDRDAETELLRILWDIMSAFVDMGFTTDLEAMFGVNGEIDPAAILRGGKPGETA